MTLLNGIGFVVLTLLLLMFFAIVFRGLIGLWQAFMEWRHPHRRAFRAFRRIQNQLRQHRARLWLATRTIIMPLGIALAVVGCGTTGTTPGPSPLLTPAALRLEVGAGVRIGLDLYPAATPEVSIARDLICSEVAKTNVDPNAIVHDLETLGLTNQHTKLIIDLGIVVYNTAFSLIPTNSLTNAQPYLDSLCGGFSDALAPAHMGTMRKQILPPHLK